jgi:hypothetical protein
MVDRHAVAEARENHKAFDQVIAVSPLADDMKRKIDLGRRPTGIDSERDVRHLMESVSPSPACIRR